MMAIPTTCPQCRSGHQIDHKFAGQIIACPGCGSNMAVPQGGTSSSSTVVILVVVLAVGGFLFIACGGIMAALMLPAIQAAREAARRTQCANHMRQIGLAMHSYNEDHGTLPPAYLPDESGEPAHSWRTLILPYMQQNRLYENYDVSKPWDSPENRRVVETPVAMYGCESADNSSMTETNYFVVTGVGTAFDGSNAVTFDDVTDGMANTIMIVEVVGLGIDWAEPRDIGIEEFLGQVRQNSVSGHRSGFNALIMDGTVQFISTPIDEQTLRNAITIADGQTTVLP